MGIHLITGDYFILKVLKLHLRITFLYCYSLHYCMQTQYRVAPPTEVDYRVVLPPHCVHLWVLQLLCKRRPHITGT